MISNTLKTITMKTADTGATERIQAIDVTKGILVLFMVLYHSLNYLYPGPLAYTYMGFLAPSFIMITGFIITQIYLPRYRLDIKGYRTRLAVRSLKLLLIFTVLNLGFRIVWSKYHQGITFEIEGFFWDWIDIYIAGGPRTVAFEVLLPISYTLLLSICVPRLQSATPYAVPFFAMVTFGAGLLMEQYSAGFYHMILISSGVIGMAFGLLPVTLINGFVVNWINFSLLIVLYGCCFFFWGYNDYTRIFLTIITLLIIYSIGVRTKSKQWFTRQTVLLGQYSLVSYIIQILYLRIFIAEASRHIAKPNLIMTVIIITIMMWATVLIVDHAQKKYAVVNHLYRMVFA